MNAVPPPAEPKTGHAARLQALRAQMQAAHVDGVLVPRSDEFQGEYVPPSAERLAWLTGFTGSAGLAAVGRDHAAIFVDGRYTLQADAEVPASLFDRETLTDEALATWLGSAIPAGGRIGYDPWLHTTAWVERLRAALAKRDLALVPLSRNPVDAVWTDRPAPPLAPITIQPDIYAGRSSAEKREDAATELDDARLAAAVLGQPDSIAWLLNIRGDDVAFNPLPLAFAILNADATVDLFVEPEKLTDAVRLHLGNAVRVHGREAFGDALDALKERGRPVRVDANGAASWIVDRLSAAGIEIDRGQDPCLLPKACKNAAEIEGARAAHRRDGAAVSRFLAWLAAAPQDGSLDEIAVADRLEAFRRESDLYRGPSFATIAGFGPNGAIVHYRASAATSRRIEPGLLLIDSGGQYQDGTTDITRTVAIGQPTQEMRDRFTRVLKGHIAISTAHFPVGTSGAQLDAMARRPLWQAGLDYDHGTGHGVGSYLSVHEGPARIHKANSGTPLAPGMILSNEPGYYKTGAYGIRIENLELVREASVPAGGERPMLCFETLTLAPIDRALIDLTLLSMEERAWIDAYHARVYETLSPLVDDDTRRWLSRATMGL